MKVRRRYESLAAEASRTRADELCASLREYGGRRINSRLIDERRCVPPHVALDFGNQGLFGMHVEERWGGTGSRRIRTDRAEPGTHFLAMEMGAVATAHGTREISGDKVWIGRATRGGTLTAMAHAGRVGHVEWGTQ